MSVGRPRIELRQFTVPPAPDDDLPDIVRFQAVREFNELDEQWRLDFLPMDAAADGPKTVLATAIAPAEIAAIEQVCAQAGLTLRRILLRPCEAATLATGGAGGKRPQLLIEIFADEVDLTVLVGGKTVFLRTTRFGGDRPAVPALVAEIRLTLAAARNQLGAEKGQSVQIESLLLCGRESADGRLAGDLAAELGMPVDLLDPFAGLAAGARAVGRAARAPEPLCAPVGHVAGRASRAGATRSTFSIRGGGRSLSAGGNFGIRWPWPPLYCWSPMWFMPASNTMRWPPRSNGMKARSDALDESLKKGAKSRLKAAEIGRWADQETIWLDELWASVADCRRGTTWCLASSL